MIREMIILSIVSCLSVGLAVFILYRELEIRRTYKQLNEMLDDVIADRFKEGKYDESMMSKVSVKLKRFLQSSQLSLDRINREKEAIKALISDISHQTKTPITNILMYLQLLLEDEQKKPQDREQLELIAKQSVKLDFLIQALVKTSRLEAGVIAIKQVPGLLNKAVSSAMEQVQGKAKQKSINLILNAQEEEYPAVFDFKWTVEAIYNVLDNAVKYTGQGGTVSVSLQNYEMFVRLDIKDTGMGIQEEDLNRIFLRFYRGEASKDQEGVGIGLYLTRKILTEEGGYIKVKSRPGEGSQFSLFFVKKG